jgi:ATP-dependent helicase Lhr and Lhr-like helicase
VSPFDRLHPALQHHIVNSLGWNTLRPTQLAAIDPILGGRNVLLLAPTAGGKTEAATFPMLSRILSERWDGLSVLYLCPLRALLNNLEPRLQRYAALVGRAATLWHGDVTQGAKRSALREPPDLLLTTPESLEAMLISRRVDHRVLFAGLRAVVVDELHAFAGDDRGWHLLALLERLERIAGRKLQRIGLSATVGNPDALLAWLTCGDRDGDIVGDPGGLAGGDVTIDHVGTLENAALVLSRLFRGEKRLVFCDSRAKVEALAVALREYGVSTFVSHSSLGAGERRRAEEAFSTASDCVIVATSTLELGVDVGDLDRVIQIDAPTTVSSFLQRMGRAGRRADSTRNCLFLTTSDEAFLQALGIVWLWRDGFVEPVTAPPLPVHLLAQQIMALVLQEQGLPLGEWRSWLGRVFRDIPLSVADRTLAYMLVSEILVEDGGILGMGPRGEVEFGGRNFIELASAFTTPLLITVRAGTTELGQIDPTSLRGPDGAWQNLLLSGRSWKVTSVDWPKRIAWAEPTSDPGRSSWFGSSRALHFDLCQAIEKVIVGRTVSATLSKRAVARLEALGEGFAFCDGETVPLVPTEKGQLRWWTFAGASVNAMLADVLGSESVTVNGVDDFGFSAAGMGPGQISGVWHRIEPERALTSVPGRIVTELKFASCLPPDLAEATLVARLSKPQDLHRLLKRRPKLCRSGIL